MNTITLTERERRVLVDLEYWCRRNTRKARPMDVGGHSRSHHSYTLGKLARLGLVTRYVRGVGMRGSLRYSISDAGVAWVKTNGGLE